MIGWNRGVCPHACGHLELPRSDRSDHVVHNPHTRRFDSTTRSIEVSTRLRLIRSDDFSACYGFFRPEMQSTIRYTASIGETV